MSLYKITTQDDKSIMADDSAQVQYIPGEFVSAPEHLAKQGYHLCVFSTVEDAQSHCVTWKALKPKIWECECDSEVPLPPFRVDGVFQQEGRKVSDAGEKEKFLGWPGDTKMFKRVKILTCLSES